MAARWPESPSEGVHSADADREAHDAAGGGEQGGFDQELTHEPKPARAERCPDRKLSRAMEGAIQHQIRHVRTRDQDDQDGDRGEGQPRRIGDPAEEAIVDRHDARPDSSARLRNARARFCRRSIRFPFGRPGAGPGPQAAEDAQRPRVSAGSCGVCCRGQREPDIGSGREARVLGENADDPRRHTVHEDGTLDTRGSDLYRERHRPLVSIATRGAPGRSSSAANIRPMMTAPLDAAAVAITSSVFALTYAASTRSGDRPSSAITAGEDVNAAMPASVRTESRKSLKSG